MFCEAHITARIARRKRTGYGNGRLVKNTVNHLRIHTLALRKHHQPNHTITLLACLRAGLAYGAHVPAFVRVRPVLLSSPLHKQRKPPTNLTLPQTTSFNFKYVKKQVLLQNNQEGQCGEGGERALPA